MPSACFGPWKTVCASPRLKMMTERLSDGLAGVTVGAGRIWLDDRLTEVERQCVLTHELVHMEAGHEGHRPEAVKRWVREQVVRRLVRLEGLLLWSAWPGALWELAEELGVVTHCVLVDRLQMATTMEREQLCASAH